MQTKPKRIIYVATHKELMCESYYRRLWLAARNVPIARRAWLDKIADTVRDFEGTIVHSDGSLYRVPLVDEVFGDDIDMRWIGYYFKADPDSEEERPKSWSRKFYRLQLIDLYFRIKHPELVQRFYQ